MSDSSEVNNKNSNQTKQSNNNYITQHKHLSKEQLKKRRLQKLAKNLKENIGRRKACDAEEF